MERQKMHFRPIAVDALSPGKLTDYDLDITTDDPAEVTCYLCLELMRHA